MAPLYLTVPPNTWSRSATDFPKGTSLKRLKTTGIEHFYTRAHAYCQYSKLFLCIVKNNDKVSPQLSSEFTSYYKLQLVTESFLISPIFTKFSPDIFRLQCRCRPFILPLLLRFASQQAIFRIP